MFRSLNEDEGLENEGYVVDETGPEGEKNTAKRLSTIPGKEIQINRPHLDQQRLNNDYNFNQGTDDSALKSCFSKIQNTNKRQCLMGIFPIFSWLSKYSCKDDFAGDVISGCTVAIMHIPQGMGYALLANLPPIVGIYMAFFPVLLYIVFGTSRHNSMGTFAVVSIMVGKAISTYSSSHPSEDGTIPYSGVQIAVALSFIIGVIQLIMYVFRLGIVSFLLSETLVSGFTTGAAIHVFTSQLKDLFGLTLRPIAGEFKLIKTYIEIFEQFFTFQKFNWVACLITVITITILLLNNEWLKPILAKKSSFPVPIELIIVVGGTIVARSLAMESRWEIKSVGHIPTGLPEFVVPEFSIMRDLMVDAFTIAMVSYTVSVSMALIFGQKFNYEIDFNQELLAMGAGNILGSFFSCMPISASLSRSLIQQTVGGKTQIASLISCSLLLIVLLWIGPFFEQLPRCMLASVVVVALKGMLMQISQFRKFNKLNRMDGCVWMGTFLTVVIVSIDIGLLVGIILSVFCIFCNSMSPYVCLLGHIPNTDLYLDIDRFDKAIQIPNLKIFHYCGVLNFATKTTFKNALCDILRINITKELKYMNQLKTSTDTKTTVKASQKSNINFKSLILDFTALSFIDPSAVIMLKQLITEFNNLNIRVTIAGCSVPVYEVLRKCDLVEENINLLFPSVHDAVVHDLNIV